MSIFVNYYQKITNVFSDYANLQLLPKFVKCVVLGGEAPNTLYRHNVWEC